MQAAQASQAATTDGSAGKASTESGTAEPSAHPGKHSAAAPDPTSNALALLENALAGALAAIPAVAAAANAAAAATGSTSSQSGQSSVPQSVPVSAGSQLIQTLAADAKASASTPASTAGASAAPPVVTAAAPSAATAGAVTAALTAAQLTAGSHVGSQQVAPDSRSMTLSSQVGSSGWTDELGAKVTWMANQGIQSASLQLSPEHLGPLQVNISVHDGQASVWFGAAQPDTRAALQQSLPQLRQLFANQGLTLADAGVSRESPRGQGQQTPARGGGAVSAVAGASLDGAAGNTQVGSGLGLIDTYV